MKLIKELSDSCTTQEVITICEDLQKKRHKVVIEHWGDKIQLYDDGADFDFDLDAELRAWSAKWDLVKQEMKKRGITKEGMQQLHDAQSEYEARA